MCQFSNPVFFTLQIRLCLSYDWKNVLIDWYSYIRHVHMCVQVFMDSASEYRRVECAKWQLSISQFSSVSLTFNSFYWRAMATGGFSLSKRDANNDEPGAIQITSEFQIMFESIDDLTMSWLTFLKALQLSASGMRCNLDSKTFTFHMHNSQIYGKWKILPPLPPLNEETTDKL